MGKSCHLCYLEIWNETYVVNPNYQTEETHYYHFTCYLVLADNDLSDDAEDEELLEEEFLDMISRGVEGDKENIFDIRDLAKQFPSAA